MNKKISVKEKNLLLKILNGSGSQTTDLASFFDKILKIILEDMHFDGGGIYLLDEARENAILQHHHNINDYIRNTYQKIPIDQKPFNKLYRKGELIIIENYQEEGTDKNIDIMSLASIPLFLGDVIIGAITISKKEHYTFSKEEKDVLYFIGKSIGFIIERIKTEEKNLHLLNELVSDRERFKALTENTSDITMIINKDGYLTYVNPAFEKIFGYNSQDIIGSNIISFLDPENKTSIIEKYKNAVQIKDSIKIDDIAIKKNDDNWLHVEAVLTNLFDNPYIKGMVINCYDITERKFALDLLRESEEKYRELAENSLQGIAIFRGDPPVFIFVNKMISTIFGYSKDEFLAMSAERIKNLVHPDDQEMVYSRLTDRLAGKAVTGNYEYRIIHKNGSLRWVEVFASFFLINGKQASQAVYVDITERRQANEALKIRDHAIKTASTGIVYTDPEAKITYANNEALKMFGHHNEEEIKGKHILDFFPDQKQLLKITTELNTHGKFNGQINARRGDGASYVIQISITRIYNDEGVHICTISSFMDITEHKKWERQLEDEKERLAVTLKSIGDGVITTDVYGKVLLMNIVAEELTGWTQQEAVGKPLKEIFRIKSKANRETGNPVEQVLKTRKVANLPNYTILCSRNGTQRTISDSGAPIIDKDKNIIGVVLVFRDITDKEKMETELQNIEKLESIGLLAGGIAHDFNNILTAIIGNISLAKLYCSDNKDVFDRLNEAEKASLRAKDLTTQLLTFSKGGTPIKKASSLKDIIEESALFAIHGSNIFCKFNIAAELNTVDVDKGQISQVLNNIVLNAVQAMPGGGFIIIEAQNIDIASQLAIPLKKGKYVRISIADEGMGIPPENIDKIFDPFFTTKDKGTGIGLATSFSIIKKHNGHISVASEPGKGTSFSIYLPASRTKIIAVKSEKTDYDFKGGGPALIMDDDDLIRRTSGQMLEILGYDVTFAKDGLEAIEKYHASIEQGNVFQVVIMDLTIPGGMGGKETIKKILALDPDANVIVSSGYSNDPIMSNYADYGFKGVINKPYKVDDIINALKNL